MSHGPFSFHFQWLLVASCFLDLLQALTTSFRYHYLPIQLAGLSMRRAYQAEPTKYRDDFEWESESSHVRFDIINTWFQVMALDVVKFLF